MIRPRALLGIALLLAGCVTPPAAVVPRPVAPELYRPVLERLRAAGAERTAVRGLATVRLDSPAGSGRIKEVIIVERPARLRLETLNFLNQTEAVLVSDGSGFAYYDGRAVARGDRLGWVLRERFGLDMSPEEVVEALLADPPFRVDDVTRVMAVGEAHEVEGAAHRLRVDPEGDLSVVQSLDQEGAVRWVARYERWRDVEGGRYPFLVRLEFPATGARAEVALRRVELNPRLDPGLFRLHAELSK